MFFLGYKITQFLSKILRLCNLFAVLWLFYEFLGELPIVEERIYPPQAYRTLRGMLALCGKW